MPKAILAMRSYPLTLLLAALVFALTLVLTATSVGKVGVGGDDEGSGFGGTGRSGESGGSGFGGTGSPSPFLGSTEEDEGEKVRQELDRIREELRPVDLPEALHRSIESNLLRESTRIVEASSTPADESPVLAPPGDSVDAERLPQNDAAPARQIARPTLPLPAPVIMLEPDYIIETFQLPIAQPEIAEQVLEINKAELIKEELQLAEGDILHQESDESIEDSDERRVAPDRIPRPELPPFQRIRPAVDRISISAPRPQPLRI